MADDGLLDPGTDLQWLIDTTIIMAAAQTYLLVTRLTSSDLDACQDWLATTTPRRDQPGQFPATQKPVK
jgi:hypothetical protein